MIFRRFRIQVLTRSLVIAAILGAGGFFAFTRVSYLLAALLLAAGAFQVVALIRYIEKTNRDLTRLLEAIRYSDFSQNFTSEGRGKHYLELTSAFRAVMDDFRAARSAREEGYRYLETVIQHIGTGLISFDSAGNVNLINSAAKRLLGVPHLKSLGTLRSISPELVSKLETIDYGARDLVKLSYGDESLQLSIHATGFKVKNELFKLVSIQDIGGELDEAEALAWRKLTRVLTHEMMNSIAPISSLATTVSDMLGGDEAEDEVMDDVRGAVKTIARRSDGLLRFVDQYRRLTRVPPPDRVLFPVTELFASVTELFATQLTSQGIVVEVDVHPTNLELAADRDQVEQVIINLLKNAVEATEGIAKPQIQLVARIDNRSRAVIEVIDNGRGIVEEALDKLFVPFFTTKKEGSGIGLSLAREIMRRHGGAISATSAPGERTVFRLRF